MLQRLRARLTYANVMATVAVFLALGGSAWALTLPRNSVGHEQIKTNAVRSSEVRVNAISASEIRGGAVASSEARNNSLTGTDIVESTLSQVPSAIGADLAQDSSKVDGIEGDALRLRCPEGTRFHAGACFENQAREPQTFAAASRDCGDENRRLPTFSELESLRQETGIAINNGINDYELTSNIYSDNGAIESLGIDQGGNRLAIAYATAKRFRCVSPGVDSMITRHGRSESTVSSVRPKR